MSASQEAEPHSARTAAGAGAEKPSGGAPAPAAAEPPADSLAVRESLVEALRLDLVGPPPGHRLADERLPERERPSKWYLTGFLVPANAPPGQSSDLGEDEEVGETPAIDGDSEDAAANEKAAKRNFFPSSIGLSFRVPGDLETLELVARWGDYERAEHTRDDGQKVRCWRRAAKERTVSVHLDSGDADLEVPDSDGLQFHVRSRPVAPDAKGSTGAPRERSVSVFLANRRPPTEDEKDRDLRFAFQAQLEVRVDRPFVPMHDLRGANAEDPDEQVADLHYADAPEFAVGHGVSVDWDTEADGCRRVRTEWIGEAEVERVETEDASGAERSLDTLGALRDGAAARAALEPLVAAYRGWIEEQQDGANSLSPRRRETAERLLHEAGVAAARIERGIEALANEPDLLDAFRTANRAVAAALRAPGAGLPADAVPRWRSFQLAFLLLNLPALSRADHPERDLVDLLFFPTGGGKTEAYLGLAAVAMVLRRLRWPQEEGRAGAGVSVIMRYTLRLLTIDQLSRAARLVCALELERERAPETYGSWPFEIGLWVGKAATPNQMGRKGDRRDDTARAKVLDFQRDGREPPIPLASCPWCGRRFEGESFQLEPNTDRPLDLRLRCAEYECEFGGDRSLPVIGVDEPLYRRLPAFLIATVDKFAALPWTAESGLLLGGATHSDADGFYGPGSSPPAGARLSAPLPPPDLVIQDEVHLISGPLGTMVGLYETTIGGLCSLRERAAGAAPKIVASTATSRGANEQMQAVFARPRTALFPPPGITRGDSFFARARTPDESPARRYLGLTAPGRSPRVLMRRVLLALMGAAQRAFLDAGWDKNENNPADPYMTVLGYFNNLRVLGGARRIIEEEVGSTVRSLGMRRRLGEERGPFRDREIRSDILELTSRVSTGAVAEARERLRRPFGRKNRVDCALATNMISVGMDIQRLGLMVVLGQPKVHAEYIQATSRVGRDASRPGLVVTLLSIGKPRDRSHYERFRHYHETFYRSVEAATVTPFSSRALDRGFAGAMVALARHAEPTLTPASGAGRIVDAPADLRERVASVFRERIRQQPLTEGERNAAEAGAQARTADLFDTWGRIRDGYLKDGAPLRYQRHEGPSGPPLLREVLDRDFESKDHGKFRAARSLRDVEPEVRVFVHDPVSRETKP